MQHNCRYTITKFALATLLGVLALWAAAQVQLARPIPQPAPRAIVTPARPIPQPEVRARVVDPTYLPGNAPEDLLIGLLRHGIQPSDLNPDDLWEIDRLTAYNAVPEQTDEDPDIAACGPLEHAQLPVIAVSRDKFLAPDGSKPHCGRQALVIAWDHTNQIVLQERRVIYDTMADRFQNTADLLLPGTDPTNANHWGVKQGLIALLPDAP